MNTNTSARPQRLSLSALVFSLLRALGGWGSGGRENRHSAAEPAALAAGIQIQPRHRCLPSQTTARVKAAVLGHYCEGLDLWGARKRSESARNRAGKPSIAIAMAAEGENAVTVAMSGAAPDKEAILELARTGEWHDMPVQCSHLRGPHLYVQPIWCTALPSPSQRARMESAERLRSTGAPRRSARCPVSIIYPHRPNDAPQNVGTNFMQWVATSSSRWRASVRGRVLHATTRATPVPPAPFRA